MAVPNRRSASGSRRFLCHALIRSSSRPVVGSRRIACASSSGSRPSTAAALGDVGRRAGVAAMPGLLLPPPAARHPIRCPPGPVLLTGPERGPPACGQLSRPRPGDRNGPVTGSDGQQMISLTVNEIRRLHSIFCGQVYPPGHHLRWSAWRRRAPGPRPALPLPAKTPA